MMFFFTPFSFFFSSLYVLLLFFMFSVSNFYFFWLLIEIRTLVFIGIGYSIYKNNFSQLLLFFIIQTIAAFTILVFYLINMPSVISIAFLLKLAMFPFYFWYFDLVYMFPNFLFFFSSTLFKVPSLILLLYFVESFYLNIIIISSVFTIISGSIMIMYANDFRFILLASSVANNSWFVFSQIVDLVFFIMYLIVYSFFLLLSLFSLHNLFTSSLIKSSADSVKVSLLFPLLVLSGIPPFPLFFIKMLIVLNLVFYQLAGVWLVFALLSNVLILLGYLKSCFFLIMYNNSNQQAFFYRF